MGLESMMADDANEVIAVSRNLVELVVIELKMPISKNLRALQDVISHTGMSLSHVVVVLVEHETVLLVPGDRSRVCVNADKSTSNPQIRIYSNHQTNGVLEQRFADTGLRLRCTNGDTSDFQRGEIVDAPMETE